MTVKEAREMIEKVCKWLEDGAPGATKKDIYETIEADLAREFSNELLESSGADRLGGCPLCQG